MFTNGHDKSETQWHNFDEQIQVETEKVTLNENSSQPVTSQEIN